MKLTLKTVGALTGTILTLGSLAIAADEVITTTTTNTGGTISEFSPDTLVIRSETSPEPIRYSYTKTTTYVDEAGAPVSLETVKSGLPVTVYYVKQGDRMVANKVIVRKMKTTTTSAGGVAETTNVSTTNTAGMISEFSPDTIVVRSEGSPQPLRYSYTKTTTYVDEAGAPVSLETVKSGLPVTVYYVKQGDRMIANKVVVRKTKTTTTDEPAVIKKTTTTTTESK